MTYYKQFAAMLGLELGQEFRTVEPKSKQESKDVYRIEDDGIYSAVRSNAALWVREQSTIVDRLLGGVLEPVPKPWKPKFGDEFYYCGVNGVTQTCWIGHDYDYANWKIGNCFKTSEEARTKGKEIMEELLKEYEEE